MIQTISQGYSEAIKAIKQAISYSQNHQLTTDANRQMLSGDLQVDDNIGTGNEILIRPLSTDELRTNQALNYFVSVGFTHHITIVMLTQIWRIVLASVAKQSGYFFRIASLRSQGRQHKINLTIVQMKYLMFNYIKFVAFIYWIKTSFSTLFIKQNNLSSYKDYPPQLTSLPYFVKFYLNEVIRLAGKEGYYLLLRLFCLENKVKIRFSSSCYVNSNLAHRHHKINLTLQKQFNIMEKKLM